MTVEKLKTVKEVEDFCKEFDNKYKTTTYFTELDLTTIFKIIKQNTDFSKQIRVMIGQVFKYGNNVYSNDLRLNTSYIGKLNTFYLIIKDIKLGKRFYSPMSISLFKDGTSILHPGNTRAMFYEIYHNPIQCMITDYNQTPMKFFPCNFTWNPEAQGLHWGYSQDRLNPHIPNGFKNQDLYFKEISDIRLDKQDFSFHQPRMIDPPRFFELKNNTVYINDVAIVRLINNKWKIVLE
tara:strand:- start:822 stop:1529 length:708 start_codon:yes stop_codon:yes gene_type:complete